MPNRFEPPYEPMDDNRPTPVPLKLFVWLCAAALVYILIYLAGSRLNLWNNVPQKELTPIELALHKADSIAAVNGQLVQQVNMQRHISSEQLRMLSDSIFKLNKKDAEHVKKIERLSVMQQSADLKQPITARFTDTVYRDTGACNNPNYVRVPRRYELHSDSISIGGTVAKQGITIDLLHVPDTLWERDVVRKTGFLKMGRKRSVQIYHSNSLFRTDSAAAYSVDKTATWWQRTGKPVAGLIIGAVGTGLLIKKLN